MRMQTIVSPRLFLSASLLLCASAAMGAGKPVGSGNDADAAIRQTIMRYQDALNASSTPQVLPLYSPDGVFMPPNSQPAMGISQVKQAYDDVFKRITLHVKFNIDEIVRMSFSAWAFVRTNSAGTQASHATGATTAEANSELLVLRKEKDGMAGGPVQFFSPSNPGSCS